MPQSHSNLTSLATLLENAEARRSALPPSPREEKEKKDDSGMIDLLAMQRRAQEERASIAASSMRTPVPMIASVPDPGLVSTATSLQRSNRRRLISVIAASAAMLGIAIGLGLSRGHAAPPPVAAVEPAVTAAPAPPLPAAPAVEPPTAAPVAVAAAAPPAAADTLPAEHPKPKKAKKSHATRAKGPKIVKVNF